MLMTIPRIDDVRDVLPILFARSGSDVALHLAETVQLSS